MGVSLWNPLLLPEEPLEAANAPTPAKSLSRGGFGMRFCSLGIPSGMFLPRSGGTWKCLGSLRDFGAKGAFLGGMFFIGIPDLVPEVKCPCFNPWIGGEKTHLFLAFLFFFLNFQGYLGLFGIFLGVHELV